VASKLADYSVDMIFLTTRDFFFARAYDVDNQKRLRYELAGS
jgi:hypothetical protein